jgi:type VI secretion system protein VasD
MKRSLLTGLICLAALSGCGGPPPNPPVLTLTIVGNANQNPDGTGAAQPVAVRVYQLAATAKFMQADIFAIKDREAQTLGAESMGSQEILVAPGETKVVKADLKPTVSSIGVAAMFQNIDAASWRAVESAAPQGPTALTATINKLTITLKSGSGGSSFSLPSLSPPPPPPAAPPPPAPPAMPTMPTMPTMPALPGK